MVRQCYGRLHSVVIKSDMVRRFVWLSSPDGNNMCHMAASGTSDSIVSTAGVLRRQGFTEACFQSLVLMQLLHSCWQKSPPDVLPKWPQRKYCQLCTGEGGRNVDDRQCLHHCCCQVCECKAPAEENEPHNIGHDAEGVHWVVAPGRLHAWLPRRDIVLHCDCVQRQYGKADGLGNEGHKHNCGQHRQSRANVQQEQHPPRGHNPDDPADGQERLPVGYHIDLLVCAVGPVPRPLVPRSLLYVPCCGTTHGVSAPAADTLPWADTHKDLVDSAAPRVRSGCLCVLGYL
mmetsp:Transcript_7547/g.22321  ORF Transcript_7547/g.22321 Transcript_7547/m.22321 type:complete len:288 (+) Transcript_7547:446-1309(+)